MATENFFPEIEISSEQANVMARGMYSVARAEGGVHEREKALLMSFYGETATGTSASSLSELENAPDVTPAEIASALTSEPLALLFIKSCLLMAWADNDCSGKERDLLEKYGLAVGVTKEQIADLERGVKSYLISSLVKLANVDAVVDVARKLKAT